MKGRFITFEGGEGSGKSTHAKLLAQRLEALGIDVVTTREPGGSAGAEVIRHVLLSGMAKPLGADAETILFAAARDDHVRTTIAPALEQGKWVICDRFMDLTRIYQGILGRVDARLIRGLERVTIGDVIPDLTFILDVPAGVGIARAAARRGIAQADRFESEATEFHEKLHKAFALLAEYEPARCVLVDATESKDDVATKLWTIVNTRLLPATATRMSMPAAS